MVSPRHPPHIIDEMVLRIKAGQSAIKIHRDLKVSRQTVYDMYYNLEEYGEPYPPKEFARKSGYVPKLKAHQIKGLLDFLDDQPRALLADMKQWLFDFYHVDVSCGQISRYLKKEGWSRPPPASLYNFGYNDFDWINGGIENVTTALTNHIRQNGEFQSFKQKRQRGDASLCALYRDTLAMDSSACSVFRDLNPLARTIIYMVIAARETTGLEVVAIGIPPTWQTTCLSHDGKPAIECRRCHYYSNANGRYEGFVENAARTAGRILRSTGRDVCVLRSWKKRLRSIAPRFGEDSMKVPTPGLKTRSPRAVARDSSLS
ncbi:hypothetical protein EG328_005610 [Venturia inaequalis]|uniref:Uncharacterized protein n=1 Tax=Venturia inaequalis TaxID=5025 RepID=A0A8H3Z7F9_VENIN|nr:hypothetical protein EG328_005610 [Venturia inaequalis]